MSSVIQLCRCHHSVLHPQKSRETPLVDTTPPCLSFSPTKRWPGFLLLFWYGPCVYFNSWLTAGYFLTWFITETNLHWGAASILLGDMIFREKSFGWWDREPTCPSQCCLCWRVRLWASFSSLVSLSFPILKMRRFLIFLKKIVWKYLYFTFIKKNSFLIVVKYR